MKITVAWLALLTGLILTGCSKNHPERAITKYVAGYYKVSGFSYLRLYDGQYRDTVPVAEDLVWIEKTGPTKLRYGNLHATYTPLQSSPYNNYHIYTGVGEKGYNHVSVKFWFLKWDPDSLFIWYSTSPGMAGAHVTELRGRKFR